MTGIERLRQMAEDFKSVKTAEHCTFIVNTWRGRYIDDAIADIAGQIEREQDKVAQTDWQTVRDVAADMASRVFMSATIDELLRVWSRKLTDASDGRCPAADVSMSAYDLLPPDERDAIAWVREHGGVEEVKKKWDGCVPLANVKKMVELHKAKRDRLKAHAWELERKCAERRERIRELDKAIAEMRPRLMPEGMEWLLEVWPKWSNGEYCKFGDWWKADEYSEREPSRLTKLSIYSPEQLREWEQDEGENYGYEWNFMRPANTTYRPNKVEPPAPKVLDANGAEIRVGDTVYRVGKSTFDPEYDALTVTDIRTKPGLTPIEVKNSHDGYSYGHPEDFTHRAPVLAADGKPLREGEAAWFTDNGENKLTVTKIVMLKDGASVYVRDETDDDEYVGVSPSQLTHERPAVDTWERLEEVAKNENPVLYCKKRGIDCEDMPPVQAIRVDLVRRAKALAERDA